MTETRRPKIALWHRYGIVGHIQCGGHCIPKVLERLAQRAEVHYFGARPMEPVPAALKKHAVFHDQPFTLNRASTPDKILKSVLWYFCMPFMALRCRLMGVDAVWLDETLPLSALILRVFYGRNASVTVADFFMTIYTEKRPWLRPLGRLVESLDNAAWRQLPLIFTKVKYTRTFLAQRGVAPERVHPVYNPCDRGAYYPRDRQEARRRLGIEPDALVLVHHGILHPNKGNDRIIRALAELRGELPNLRYLLVGAGPEKAALERLSADLGMTGVVRFTGWLPEERDVNEAINAADIGLVMRIGQFSDSFHMTDTLAHEMACGLPILAARLAGIEEVIREGESGLLFGPGDMNEFKGKLLALAWDEELRVRLGRAALETCTREFDPDGVASRIAEPLLRLAGGAPG